MRCTLDWKSRLPIVKWLPKYNLQSLQSDLIAGITVGLMVIPQGLAYGVLAGLPPQYGLYNAFMGSFIYCFLGSSKDVTLGPTAIMSLMVATYGRQNDAHYAVALSFFSGLLQLLMGLFSLGFIVRFIPIPVISGFTSAAAIIIGFGQLPGILGMSGMPKKLVPRLHKTFSNIAKTNYWDVVLGVACVLLLEAFRRVNRMAILYKREESMSKRIMKKIVWFVSVGRNAVIVFFTTFLALMMETHGNGGHFTLTGAIKKGLPKFEVPKLTSHDGNSTISTTQILTEIEGGLIVLPMIGFLESVAIAKAFARKNRYKVDPSQELIALGIANFVGAFCSAYPVTGSFSRTAVNSISGVATPLGGVFTGGLVMLALGVLTPFFQYIPKAALGAVILSSVIHMIDHEVVRKMWKIKKVDIIPFILTFGLCLYDIATGIVAGIACALLLLIYRLVVPRIEARQHEVTVIRINGGLTYVGIEHLATKIEEASILCEVPPKLVILDCSNMSELDFTVSQGFLQIIQDLQDNEIKMYFSRVQNHVKTMLINAGVESVFFSDDYLDSHPNLFKTEEEVDESVTGESPCCDEPRFWMSSV
ncbi:sodium-independent sulfate anion transporter-like isoform X2 [Xenia sp. Carnegie-2017]|nr:sodium-independent sulfate anion transporter-like isoform X2 [Xenia sp. Carnegie-2017]XP_046856647.1 sodium-independent sulfate anion transporter-like isoform X2 [Xenia sp. Carnegie-2017]